MPFIYALPAEQPPAIEVNNAIKERAMYRVVQARQIIDTKKTISELMHKNLKHLSDDEYNRLREMVNYVYHSPKLKARLFELTGLEQKDMEFAKKYFVKYKSKRLFARLIKTSIQTSSNGRVSRQIGGLIQFVMEIEEVNGRKVGMNYKVKLLAGLPAMVKANWNMLAINYKKNQSVNYIFSDTHQNTLKLLDINEDGVYNKEDIDLARSLL